MTVTSLGETSCVSVDVKLLGREIVWELGLDEELVLVVEVVVEEVNEVVVDEVVGEVEVDSEMLVEVEMEVELGEVDEVEVPADLDVIDDAVDCVFAPPASERIDGGPPKGWREVRNSGSSIFEFDMTKEKCKKKFWTKRLRFWQKRTLHERGEMLT